LLYQVASSLLNPSDIARPVRTVLGRSRNIRFRQSIAIGVDLKSRLVRTSEGAALAFDYLVIAAGSTSNFFGVRSVEQRALGLKDLSEALELRNHILRCLEVASLVAPDQADGWLTFVIAGAGPTGVEYAGALSELVRGILPREYPELAGRRPRIVLVEGMHEVLPSFPGDLGRSARGQLERRGVEVRTGVRVAEVTDDAVLLSTGERLPSRTVVWAAGVKPSDLANVLDVPRSRSGRVEVDLFLRVRGQDAVFAIGDIASFVQERREVPMLSAPAMQQGRTVADNILRSVAGRRLKAFRYRDRGSMATIGKNAAVAKLGPLHLHGFLGWVVWLAVHLYYIIGFRNRLAVLLGWAWNYLHSDRPIRLIARAGDRLPGVQPSEIQSSAPTESIPSVLPQHDDTTSQRQGDRRSP
jgi:NADH dehydrogenase